MPRYTRRKRRRSHRGISCLVWLLVIAILSGGAIFIVTRYFDDVKTKLEHTSYPREYSKYVEKAAKEYDLEESLIYAVIRTESGFDADAQSNVGACGIMQMMPSSFEWLQQKRGTEGEYTTQDLFNPEICIDYGSYLLKYFYDLYGDERCAVAAYNAGFVVGDWLEDSNYSIDGVTLSDIPYPETKHYVEKVESAKEMYIKLYYSQNNE